MTQAYDARTVEAVAELQLSAFLAGRGSTRSGGTCPTMDDWRATAIRALPTSTEEASEPSPLSEDDGEPAAWAVEAERAASDAYAQYMGDPDGNDDCATARAAAARAIENAALAALAPGSAADGGSDALGETVAKLIEALGKAAFQFETYERGHRGKAGTLAMTVGAHHGDTFTAIEKAERNADMAKMCRDAIAGARASTLLTALEQRQDGWPTLTDAMILAAGEAHFGKRRFRQSAGPDGVCITVNGRDWSFRQMMRRMWPALRRASAPLPTHPEES